MQIETPDVGGEKATTHRQVETSSQSRHIQAEDHMLRTLNVVDLASIFATDAFEERHLDQPLESFVEALLDTPLQHESLTSFSQVLSAHGWDADGLEEQAEHDHEVLIHNAYAADRMGFHGMAVEFGTPVRKYQSPTSFGSSWGYMSTVWVYADSFESAWQLGIQWAERMRAKALAKAGFGLEVTNG